MDNALAVWRPARNSIHCSDALRFLWQLESESVHCVVTSPPYYGLRDYGTGDWAGGDASCDHKQGRQTSRTNAPKQSTNSAGNVASWTTCVKCGAQRIDQQIGLEETPQAYLARMVAVFRDVRRVLRSDGVAFVNMGDSYAANRGSGAKSVGEKQATNPGSHLGRLVVPDGFKPKDLMMMPARLAIALQEDGWYVRSDIVWHKPNVMPSSVTDRPTTAHEYLFMLTKSSRYWTDMDAVREQNSPSTFDRWGANPIRKNASVQGLSVASNTNGESTFGVSSAGRNLRSVWTIATQPYSGAHFATFPQALVERCVKMGAPAKTCAVCGAGWQRVVELGVGDYQTRRQAGAAIRGNLVVGHNPMHGNGTDHTLGKRERTTKGFRPSCVCGSQETLPGLVFDPFMGSGTTALVARRLGRDYIGCDLSPEYVTLARKRLRDSDPFQATAVAGVGEQLSLFGERMAG